MVPYTRGSEYSRPVAQILDEAKRLAERGVKEITLLGQNVNAYHGAGPSGKTWDLAQLLGALSNVDGVERLRFTTSHPNEMTDALIAAHRDLPKLMPYLHLPFQAGSDRILKAMNRKHTMADYFRIVEKLRRARPDLALSTDIIVGFPGESDTDFQETMQVVETVKYAQAYSFKYSARPGTPAADRGGPDQRGRQVRSSSPAAILAQCSADGVQREHGGPWIGRTLGIARQEGGADRGPVSLSASRACRGRPSTDRKNYLRRNYGREPK